MNDPARDPLDQAIDRVAARLVSVDHDRAMVERLVARLPERNGLSGWLHVLVPQAAVATALVIAALVWTTSNREEVARDPMAAPPVADAGVAAREVPAPGVGVAAPAAATGVAARRVTEKVIAEPADHERSLTPVAALISIEVATLEAPSIPDEPPVVVAPLVLTALPLSGEMISPR